MYMFKWCGVYVLAIVCWLGTCINGVVVMYLWQWCGSYVLATMVLSLCTCSNGVVVMYL